jgi:hypothetical protein
MIVEMLIKGDRVSTFSDYRGNPLINPAKIAIASEYKSFMLR